MEDLEHLVVAHQVEERGEVDAFGEGVDHDGLLGARHLHHAEQGVVGGLAQEFGVHRDGGMFGEAVADGGKLGRGRNQVHDAGITLLGPVVARFAGE